ncbi:serine/threonine-protein kinase [Polyangium sp. y55x31]|uniref:serine/threonine-protein kinase n=1 Tax=Polyangium sp. y55x31 TaxID=3042688 RepID=UPI002482826A|nr:serine/threonine-protein kinase [Polyangium sp. y55x31]MDI1480427.1 serine/threonine-protein kinase [Polyangium sp. y55x31]
MEWTISDTIRVEDLPAEALGTTTVGAPRSHPPDAETPVLPRLSLSTGAIEGKPPVLSSPGVDLTLERQLGQGGMGAVYLAYQRSLDRHVAVKIPHDEAPRSASLAIIREGQVAGGLEHPNIVPVHALGLDDTGRPILVIKRIEGVSWSEVLADASHPFWERASFGGESRLVAHLEILMQVCNALHFAHTRGIVHRDVKPDNVMVGEFGEVYLLDWGVARTIDTTPGKDAEPLVGTPAYMAPEMACGEPHEIDARTDVYLLGATLHEILTGNPPHARPSLYDALLSASAGTPQDYPPEAPDELVALCNAAMSRKRDERPPSAAAFRERMADFLRHRSSLGIADAASERLEVLEEALGKGGPEIVASAEILGGLSECRFGFLQALREWPDNTRAKEGLARSLALLVEREIILENPANARALLERMEGDRAELEARVALLEAKIEERRRLERRAAEMVKEMDSSVGRRARTLFVSAVVATGAVAMGALSIREASTHRPSPWADVLIFDAVILSLFVAGLFFGRKRLLTNLFNRRLLFTVTASFALNTLHDVLSYVRGEHVWTSGAMGQLIIGSCLVVTAINSTLELLLPAAIQLAGGLLSLYVPWATGAISTIGTLITVALVLRASRPVHAADTADARRDRV